MFWGCFCGGRRVKFRERNVVGESISRMTGGKNVRVRVHVCMKAWTAPPPLHSMYTKSMASCHCGLPDLDCNKNLFFHFRL